MSPYVSVWPHWPRTTQGAAMGRRSASKILDAAPMGSIISATPVVGHGTKWINMSGAGNVTCWVQNLILGANKCDAYLFIFSRCICDVYSAEMSESDEPQPWLRLMLHLMYLERNGVQQNGGQDCGDFGEPTSGGQYHIRQRPGMAPGIAPGESVSQ